MRSKIFRKAPIAIAVSAALLQSTAFAYESPLHVFSVDDVLGGFSGQIFGGAEGIEPDTSIICDLGSNPCPEGNQPFVDKSGVMLYPVDSEFGFYVVDFLGAQEKVQDGDYREGFVGNIEDGAEVIGIQISNAPTLKYKVKPPLGTWCQGLGGTSVKCETEHYTVLEHVQSCHETIPYGFADPVTGAQKILETPDGSLTYNCADAPLDDNVWVLVDGAPDTRLIDPTPCEADNDPEGCQMFPNDKTDMLNDIALSSDYSVQLKDDGKPLYGWGGIHKRPNDVRMYARLELPAEWKVDAPVEGYAVTKAHLIVNHWITNNPNDQLRPEDLENEAATGRKPSYRIEGTPGGPDEVWKSLDDCYEGDGDFIEGETDATPIGAGTVLKNMPFALDKSATPGDMPADDPYAFSSDLYLGLTNAYYTTIQRDPFEWSYDADPDPMVQNFVGSAVPDDTLGELVSGPRWRLKPNKFGQDLPGLEIPLIECSKPPFANDNTRYETGTPVTTVINLLDWDEAGEGAPSPLANSKGWVDYNENAFITVNEDGISSNGLPMSEDFDLAVYVKGDSKSTAVYNAQLVLEYEGEVEPPPPGEITADDLSLSDPAAPDAVAIGVTRTVEVQVNNSAEIAAVDVATVRFIADGELIVEVPVRAIEPGSSRRAKFKWTADEPARTVEWTMELVFDGEVIDTVTDTTIVR